VGTDPTSTVEVGTFPANGFGLYDVHGNVWEWCADDFIRDYSEPRTQAPYVINSEMKTLRGGSYYYNVYGCRSAFRVGYGAGEIGTGVGLRLALDGEGQN
jgi:formylglycine-generating enzyme required for sulfatase activity